MRIIGRAALLLAVTWLGLGGDPVRADELQVAVASNFAAALEELATVFEAESGHVLHLSAGSTGKHYAQILHGAPYDLFFAADEGRPRRLEEEGRIVYGSRVAYAVGRLVLWSPREGLVDSVGSVLEDGDFRHLAIANPRLAPYGVAARELLEARGLWEILQPRLVRGENIAQAHHFVRSGNAELGLLAWSQVQRAAGPIEGSWWLVPVELHAPIEQHAVRLTDGAAGRDFLEFVRGEKARAIIRSHGYEIP